MWLKGEFWRCSGEYWVSSRSLQSSEGNERDEEEYEEEVWPAERPEEDKDRAEWRTRPG